MHEMQLTRRTSLSNPVRRRLLNIVGQVIVWHILYILYILCNILCCVHILHRKPLSCVLFLMSRNCGHLLRYLPMDWTDAIDPHNDSIDGMRPGRERTPGTGC